METLMARLPPLNALVAFEAVARTGSVRAASEALFVTPGAVSRQLKVLDDFLDMRLLERSGRGLALSTAGATYYQQISTHLDGIRKATEALQGLDHRAVVRLHSHTTFATRWLIPRLSRFQVLHPEVDIRLTTSSEWTPGADCDASVRLGHGDWPDYDATPLVRNVLVAVCAPSLIRPSKPRDALWLAEQTLLRVSARPDDWEHWCVAAGIDPACMTRQRVFESSAVAYEAAQDGLGIIVAQEVLVEAELQRGSLVAPFDVRVDRGEETYYLVIPSAKRHRKGLAALREALISSA